MSTRPAGRVYRTRGARSRGAGVVVFRRVRWFVIAAALLAPSAGIAQVQVSQTFIPQGPSPKFGPSDVVQSADASPNGSVAGAIQSILLDPTLGPQTMFIGGVNGGIWRTTRPRDQCRLHRAAHR